MITERAMLAAVHISIWTAVKHDRKISRDVADQHGAHQGAGRYNKQLLRGADKLEELRTLAGQVRQYFYKITLPWSDEGFRLLPSNLYFDLTTRMREFEASFEQGVESFLQVYPQYIEQVRPELNGLFREEDYPAAEKLRKKFGVKLEILPIPSGNDFRVQMSAEEQARVAREIDANVRAVPDARDRRSVEAAQGGGLAHGGSAERAGVALPRHAGHERLRSGGAAASPERQWRRGTEPLCRADQTAAVQLLGPGPQEARSAARG